MLMIVIAGCTGIRVSSDFDRKADFSKYKTFNFSKEVDKVSGLGRQVIAAILLAGILIGSAIALVGVATLQPEGNLGIFMARLAYIGYLVAMVGGLLMILRLFWRWVRGRGANDD